MKSANWFEVSKEGLKELQLGKPKHYVLRELLQNAFDEDINKCVAMTKFENGTATIIVADDSKKGFRDLSHGYTMFANTYKRKDPSKRGRFNCGEKESFAICETALIETTTGTVIFNEEGRKITEDKTKRGSRITVTLKMTRTEYDEMLDSVSLYLIPEGIKFSFNGSRIDRVKPLKSFTARLLTEIEEDKVFRRKLRETEVRLYKPKDRKAMLFEIGIPVTDIECDYDIDVQQKIPLGADRESIVPSYLKNLYTEVLNNTYEDIREEDSSNIWVRTAITGKNIMKEAVEDIVTKRFGDKAVIANPFDRNSIDEAISEGYRVIHGSEMSKDEWDKVKEEELMQTSSDLFGKEGFAKATQVKDLTSGMKAVEKMAKKIAKKILALNLNVKFIECREANTVADFCSMTKTLRLNVSRLSDSFFDNPIRNPDVYSLIIHELGHNEGNHTEKAYHDALTNLAGELIVTALRQPKFLEVE